MLARFEILRTISITLFIGILFLAGCNKSEHVIGGSGFIETDEITISSETYGLVNSIFFDEGLTVNRFDTLAIIDPSRLELELASAKAALKVNLENLQSAQVKSEQAVEAEKYARSERNRVAALAKSGGATPKELDQFEFELTRAVLNQSEAEAAVKTAKAELEKIEADIKKIERDLKNCYPISPITGMVLEQYVEVGEFLSMGKPIAKIAALDTVWVKIYLPSGDLASIKIGDRFNVSTESGEQAFDGKVIWTSDEAEFTPKNVQTQNARANLVYAVKVQVPNPDGYLKIGMPVYATIKN